jgi:hypothetical protein
MHPAWMKSARSTWLGPLKKAPGMDKESTPKLGRNQSTGLAGETMAR